MQLTISVADGDETYEQTVDAWQFGAFAVHRAIGADLNWDNPWRVTHIRTCKAMPINFDSFDRAAACAQLLNSALLLGDFDAPEGEAYAAFAARAPRIIKGIQSI